MNAIIGQQVLALDEQPESLGVPVRIERRRLGDVLLGGLGDVPKVCPSEPVVIGEREETAGSDRAVEAIERALDVIDVDERVETGDDVEPSLRVEVREDGSLERDVFEGDLTGVLAVSREDWPRRVVPDDGRLGIALGEGEDGSARTTPDVRVRLGYVRLFEELAKRFDDEIRARTRTVHVLLVGLAPVTIPVDRVSIYRVGHRVW